MADGQRDLGCDREPLTDLTVSTAASHREVPVYVSKFLAAVTKGSVPAASGDAFAVGVGDCSGVAAGEMHSDMNVPKSIQKQS